MDFFRSIFRRRSEPNLVLGSVVITEKPALVSLSPRIVEAQFQRAQKVVPPGILNPYEMQTSADYAQPVLDELKNLKSELKAEGHDFEYQLFQRKNSWVLGTNVRLKAFDFTSRRLDQRLSLLFEDEKIKAWGDEFQFIRQGCIYTSREVCEISGGNPDYSKIITFVKHVIKNAIKDNRLTSGVLEGGAPIAGLERHFVP